MNLKETLCLWPRTAFVKVKTKESALVGWSLSTYICVNVCICMYAYVCMFRKCTLAPKTGHEFYGGTSYKAL